MCSGRDGSAELMREPDGHWIVASRSQSMNNFIYHVASGQAFFSGVALFSLAVGWANWRSGRWAGFWQTILACAGLILIVASATPLPFGYYLAAGGLTVAWFGWGRSRADSLRRRRLVLRALVFGIWWAGVAWELPWHVAPGMPKGPFTTLAVLGDSVTAGMGGEAETWPGMLARRQGIRVQDASQMGATVKSALEQAGQITGTPTLVLAEIGGNDLLGSSTPEAYERGLDALLSRLKSDGQQVVMLELPLPPFANRYGRFQRGLARKYGVRLVPKRVLLGVLTTEGATVDSIHLSPTGHALMAETIWHVVRPAFTL